MRLFNSSSNFHPLVLVDHCILHVAIILGVLIIFYLSSSFYIFYLKFCKEAMSLLSNLFMYSIIYLYFYGLMDIYFILWVIWSNTIICFVTQIVLFVAIGSSFSLAPVLFDKPNLSLCFYYYFNTYMLSGTIRCSKLIHNRWLNKPTGWTNQESHKYLLNVKDYARCYSDHEV